MDFGCDWLGPLIAEFRSIDDDTITAIQRVRLDADGRKVDRVFDRIPIFLA